MLPFVPLPLNSGDPPPSDAYEVDEYGQLNVEKGALVLFLEHLRTLETPMNLVTRLDLFDTEGFDVELMANLTNAIKKGLFPRLKELYITKVQALNECMDAFVSVVESGKLGQLRVLALQYNGLKPSQIDNLSVSISEGHLPMLDALWVNQELEAPYRVITYEREIEVSRASTGFLRKGEVPHKNRLIKVFTDQKQNGFDSEKHIQFNPKRPRK